MYTYIYTYTHIIYISHIYMMTKAQVDEIGEEKGAIGVDTTEMKRIIRKCNQQEQFQWNDRGTV